jgi:hypothetical protein
MVGVGVKVGGSVGDGGIGESCTLSSPEDEPGGAAVGISVGRASS